MGPDQQLRRAGRRAPGARPPRRLRGGRVVHRRPRGARVRGARDADGAGRGGRRPDGRSLGRVHPSHGSGVPAADDRAAGDGDEADLGGAGRGRPALPRPADGDLGRRPPGPDLHRQRDRLPRRRARGLPLGEVRLGEPARDARPLAAAAAVRPARGRSLGVGGVPLRVPAGPRGAARRAQRVPPVGRRRGVPSRRVQHPLARAQPVSLPRGSRLPTLAPARRHMAPAAVDRSHIRRAVRRAGASARWDAWTWA
jgi:hypothetical protein